MTSKRASIVSSSRFCPRNRSPCLTSERRAAIQRSFREPIRRLSPGRFSIGAGVNDDRGGTFNTFVLGDDLSWSKGSHNFRFGGEGSYYELNRYNNFATRGSVTFGNATGLGWFSEFPAGPSDDYSRQGRFLDVLLPCPRPLVLRAG